MSRETDSSLLCQECGSETKVRRARVKPRCGSYSKGGRCFYWNHLRCGKNPCLFRYTRTVCTSCDWKEGGYEKKVNPDEK